jgi:hypothetical protein
MRSCEGGKVSSHSKARRSGLSNLLNMVLLVLSAVESHDGQRTAQNPHDRNRGFRGAYND